MQKRLFVKKRDGRMEPVKFDKITSRIQQLCYGLDKDYVDESRVAQKVCSGIYAGVTTSELDELAAETAAHLSTEHPDYGLLAARIAVSNLHKNTQKSFFAVMTSLYQYEDKKLNRKLQIISNDVFDFIRKNAEELDAVIVYSRDYNYDYFGFKTLERSYLLKINGKVVERPQHMLMRVACGIHYKTSIKAAIETYEYMSNGLFIHATPTLYNSGTIHPQLSSCFLITIKDDSIEGIYDTLKDTALISKQAGGIGLAVSRIRSSGSYIAGTNGTSNGLVPMLRVYNNTARYVDQSGRRKGSFAIYLEPWHADIFEFLELRKNHGAEELRARDLFYALWIPDLFMRRVRDDGNWSLLCPNKCPGLEKVWGKEFDEKYEEYEKSGKVNKVIKARDLWDVIEEAQIETGNPYMVFKDHCNAKSNHQNLGTIECSNLCTEIIQYTAPDEIAVCNLASIALPKYVDQKLKKFDHDKLAEAVRILVRNIDIIIDINHYPVKEAKISNLKTRPMGLGVQGLADTFILMRYPFESKDAQILNRDIFETIYFAALSESNALAMSKGVYPAYEGSPVSKGILQFDMWDYKPESKRHNWNELRENIKKHGVRNSLLVAPMPTASTSQILGNNECFEPYTSNLYVRRTLAGEFVCVSKHLLKDLVKLGIWTPKIRNKLMLHNGSVQEIAEIPDDIKELYKTVWEMKNKTLVDMAYDRSVFIDQSSSLNIFMRQPTKDKLTNLHFYTWSKGLKTGMYYLRTQAATEAIKFTIEPESVKEEQTKKKQECTDEVCTSCSS